MTTLDQRLYVWLLEPDERRFQLAFRAYYSVAFPALIRRLRRLSLWDPSELEELAQDALLKFFERVGEGRRQASAKIGGALGAIEPLDLGALHEHHVRAWTRDVASFQAAAMSFSGPRVDVPNDTSWKAVIRSLAEGIQPLQRSGWFLIDGVRLALNWYIDGPDAYSRELPAVVDRVARDVREKSAQAREAETRLPGTLLFIESTFVVSAALPHLRVPTNSYLFEIATTAYLDECRRRSRRKRGGNCVSFPRHAEHYALCDRDASPSGECLVDSDLQSTADVDSYLNELAPPSDPAARIEGEDFLRRFYEYLRAPLDQAIEALGRAETNGVVTAARRKAAALSSKFSVCTSVLAMMGEGYTQAQTAATLGISRNQVKYIIEKVQDCYARFAAATVRSPARRQAEGAPPHVS